MRGTENTQCVHRMSDRSLSSFFLHEADLGASDNSLRRCKKAVRTLFDALPEDKLLSEERLWAWRRGMEEQGYASVTVGNYVKCINRYLDFVGCSAIRFRQGRAKNITDETFGLLRALEPTGETLRGDRIWRFRCQCGNEVCLPAARVRAGNTLSCGCRKAETLREARMYREGTSLVQSLTDRRESTLSRSGYTGVSPKGERWQAYITYKGVRRSLGCYALVEDAVKARARAKELVMADAEALLTRYLEERSLSLPGKKPNKI